MTGLHIFGVRHLSPAGAWHLSALLDKVRPKVVCIEGLADAAELVPFLTKKGAKPPVAILAYTDSLPVRTLVYPLASYSPEYVAMVWAAENKARVEFIDLPSDVFLGLQDVELERRAKQQQPEQPWRPEPAGSIYERVAQRSGEDSYDSYWERHFEHNTNHDVYQHCAYELGAALRAEPDETVWRAENLVREAFMRRRINEVIASGVKPEQMVAVVGAFHAPVLSDEHPAMTDTELASLRKRGSKLTLMPYSYFKLSTQSGYGAGNRAPMYFELFWQHLKAGTLTELPMHYLAEVTRHLRDHGTHRSTAEVIEAVRLARTLAAMHEGSQPTLQDLHDAAVTLVGGGQLSPIAEALAHVDVGTAIGMLPKGMKRTSIQEDFDEQMTRLKLEKYRKTTAEELVLDLRENRYAKTAEAAFIDLNRSSFLHRLKVLEIGFAVPLKRGASNSTWVETWKLQWNPEHEIALVEAVLLGETVDVATGYKFRQRLDTSTTIAPAAEVVLDACLCGLPSSMDAARSRLQELAAVSSDLVSIADATMALSMTVRYGDVRQFDTNPLKPLIETLFVQGALALLPAANCDQQAATKLAEAIEELNRVSLEHYDHVEGELWMIELQKLAEADDRNPLLSGYAMSILLERGLIKNDDLAREVSRRLSPGVPADLGAGWFEGLSRRNRASLLARQALWVELAGYVHSLDDDQFQRSIVFLRRAFGSFTPAQKRQICENLAEGWGVSGESVQEMLDTELNQAEQQKITELNEFNFDDL